MKTTVCPTAGKNDKRRQKDGWRCGSNDRDSATYLWHTACAFYSFRRVHSKTMSSVLPYADAKPQRLEEPKAQFSPHSPLVSFPTAPFLSAAVAHIHLDLVSGHCFHNPPCGREDLSNPVTESRLSVRLLLPLPENEAAAGSDTYRF
ncbi:hypothetical protein DPEC_G00292510 [Dallia pectoralis]|uniref:Uncharacterized protein n=1 Tax=Dallia pectoralis TaxID=75939 RepID=A0ACC2FI15_DALPE|nr:hypothetical protein DPEC_G00292510 [Dallia pectoralis]